MVTELQQCGHIKNGLWQPLQHEGFRARSSSVSELVPKSV